MEQQPIGMLDAHNSYLSWESASCGWQQNNLPQDLLVYFFEIDFLPFDTLCIPRIAKHDILLQG
jgi:hypothetical protein